MKIMFWSDLHIHPWQDMSKIGSDGLNDRLLDTIDVIGELNSICEEENIRHRIFGGDLFHKRGEINTTALSLMLSALVDSAGMIEDHFIVGNHDWDLNNKYHMLRAFANDWTHIWDEPWLVELEGSNVVFSVHPWNEDRLEWRDGYLSIADNSCLFSVGHYDFKDILYRGHSIGQGAASRLVRSNTYFFSGHYHDHIVKNNVVYVGSPIQHNWGDIGSPRGYIIIEVSKAGNVTWKWHPLKGFSEFVEVRSVKEAAKKDLRNNFVRVVSPSGFSDKERDIFVELFKEREVRGYKFYEEVSEISEENLEEEKDKYSTENILDIVQDYVDTRETKLNKKRLKRIGGEFING